jgi:predicted 3-demethylubiquinone-9 3-methyltransferase (glyoxalase superfamily)
MLKIQRIRPCLWFDSNAEEAVAFYLSIFPDSHISRMTRYTDAGYQVHQMAPGTVMTIEFELKGEVFVALNGGPRFKFNEAVSFQIDCETQAEVDYYWDRLSIGGDPAAQRCGWLKDQYGLSWQVVPLGLRELFDDPDPKKREAVMTALLEMRKIDIVALRRLLDQA